MKTGAVSGWEAAAITSLCLQDVKCRLRYNSLLINTLEIDVFAANPSTQPQSVGGPRNFL